MHYSREEFPELFEELLPLAELHYKEIAWRQSQIPLAINYPRYCTLNDTGVLLCFTAREGQKLLAYSLFFVTPHMHYLNTTWAVNDIVFVHPSVRNKGVGTHLVRYCETELRSLGAQVIVWHIKPKLDWSELLIAEGYEPGDKMWAKWIGGDDS